MYYIADLHSLPMHLFSPTLPCNILSETSQPDADRDGEDVATDAVPQNQSNNGNQSLSPSEDKMAEVLEEANEEEESTKSPERTSEKSSPEEEQPGNNWRSQGLGYQILL